MEFAVIIPCLNEADQVGLAIQSAWQAGASRVVVADGGSTDGTRSIAAEHQAQVIESPPGRGLQMNRGAAATTQAVLVFLHADNRLPPAAGKQLIEAVSAGSPFCCFRQQIEGRHWLYRWIETGNAWRARIQGLPYGDQAFSITRELFESVGGFDEIPLMEDVSLARKLRRLARPRLLPGPLRVSDRRWQANGIVRQTLANWWTLWRYRLGATPDQLAQSYRRRSGKPIDP